VSSGAPRSGHTLRVVTQRQQQQHTSRPQEQALQAVCQPYVSTTRISSSSFSDRSDSSTYGNRSSSAQLSSRGDCNGGDL